MARQEVNFDLVTVHYDAPTAPSVLAAALISTFFLAVILSKVLNTWHRQTDWRVSGKVLLIVTAAAAYLVVAWIYVILAEVLARVAFGYSLSSDWTYLAVPSVWIMSTFLALIRQRRQIERRAAS